MNSSTDRNELLIVQISFGYIQNRWNFELNFLTVTRAPTHAETGSWKIIAKSSKFTPEIRHWPCNVFISDIKPSFTIKIDINIKLFVQFLRYPCPPVEEKFDK